MEKKQKCIQVNYVQKGFDISESGSTDNYPLHSQSTLGIIIPIQMAVQVSDEMYCVD